MEREKTPNGHGDMDDTVVDLSAVEPLEWPEPRRSWLRKGWRIVTGRPSRAAAESGTAREGTLLARWMPLCIFLVLQLGGAIYWVGVVNTRQSQHAEQLLELRGIKEQYQALMVRLAHEEKQREKLEAHLEEWRVYSQDTREKLASGQFRLRDLPRPPSNHRQSGGD
jgi:hypothetical protein